MYNAIKNRLKGGSKALLITMLSFFVGIENKQISVNQQALQKEQIKQEKRDNIDNRSIAEVVAATTSDRFTQTEAHLQLPEVRKLIEKNYQVEPYLNLIATVLANEAKFKDTHYAFYNTTPNEWRLAQDLFTRLYAYEHPINLKEGFKFLRFNNESINATAQGFLVNELKEKGLVDDNTETGAIMISVNLALFGNVGFPGECSWDYFVNTKGHKAPRRKTFEDMMIRFGLNQKHVDEIISLVDVYDTTEDTIVQILVPKDKVDEIGYLAWVKGIPAHGETIKWILDHAKSKSFEKHVKPLMEKLTAEFKANPNNPLYKSMMEGVQAGDFSLNAFLKIYCNTPWKIEEINDVTARLLFTPNVLLNPDSGVKFFRFSTVSSHKLNQYNDRLNKLIDKLIAEKEGQSQEVQTKEVQPKKTSKKVQ